MKRIIQIRLFLNVFAVFIAVSSFGQDIQFSQFYNVPLYQNPAFAGSAHRLRASLHQRIQWPGLSSRYLTSLVYVDDYFAKYNSGVGLQVFKDWQGASTINSLDISAYYSYEIHLSSEYTLRTGLSASVVQRTINYSKLMFPSQFDDTIGYMGGSSPLEAQPNNVLYPDIGSGAVLYNDDYWIGVAAHHLNSPNQSFIRHASHLPLKLAFTGGYKIKIQEVNHAAYMDEGKEISIIPTFHYKFQGTNDQFDLGIYGIYDMIIAGVWYRGIPIKKYLPRIQNNEAIIFSLGWKIKEIAITYSYDYTVSTLRRSGTGGAHELNITWFYYKPHKSQKPMKKLPCPQFYKKH